LYSHRKQHTEVRAESDDNRDMGTVGLAFGSPTSGAGFDVTSTVNQIVTNMQAVETPWKNQLTSLQSQDTALTSIGTDLSSLATAMQSLTDFEGVLSEKQGSSSDTSVLSLTSAATSAVAGSHTVIVQSLATTSSYVSSTISSATDSLSGSLTINGKTITIDSSNNTLSSLASAINSGSYGVTANVITDSSGSRLSLVSQISGSAGTISIASSVEDTNTSSALSFSQTQSGADAQLNVDGVSVTSASNTVTNAIQGVTFQLLSANPSESVQVEITNNRLQQSPWRPEHPGRQRLERQSGASVWQSDDCHAAAISSIGADVSATSERGRVELFSRNNRYADRKYLDQRRRWDISAGLGSSRQPDAGGTCGRHQ
jgi:hypothetical protein